MAGHATFPNAENRQRLTQHLGLVEKNVAEPAADDDTKERGSGDEIADSRRRQIGESAQCKFSINEITAKERENVGQTVPPRSDTVVNAKDQRIEIVNVISEHRVRDCHRPPFGFNTFSKNGAVRLVLFFAICSGVPVATIFPPSAPASGPISTM